MALKKGKMESYSSAFTWEGCYTAHGECVLLFPLTPTSVHMQVNGVSSRGHTPYLAVASTKI